LNENEGEFIVGNKRMFYMRSAFLVAAIIASSSLCAALPPLWQNVAELKSILSDEHLGSHLESGEAILDIKKTDQGWLIITNHHELPVHITYKESQMPGPAKFNIEFGKAQLLSPKEE
jgi:hypothetical protein